MEKKLSVSFTLGRESKANQINLDHNNREFLANNIDKNKLNQNVIFVRQDPEQVYNELFSDALKEYNDKQKKNCRKIENYYYHMLDSKREEAFYEVIVQFGDHITAPCSSTNGEECKKMLDEYLHDFEKRNPNLKVFNAILHMDEATPHLHIDFIPFYTQPRTNGLSKGVSLRAALDEQGFTANNVYDNRLVRWEESERNAMEKILNAHGFEREDKNATYEHMTVSEYKSSVSDSGVVKALNSLKNNSVTQKNNTSVSELKSKLKDLQIENKKLAAINSSPFKAFYFSSPDKQAFVQTELERQNITVRETETGFEAPEIFLDTIRDIEKKYKPVKNSYRDQLRDLIDKLVLKSKTLEDMLEKLEAEGYKVKQGKYISVLPPDGDKNIRLKSLGEQYTELALRNRIMYGNKYVSDLDKKIQTHPDQKSLSVMIMKTVKLYTVAVKANSITMKKRNPAKPLAWTNDPEIDKLLDLNRKLNEGATVDSLREDFATAEKRNNAALEKYTTSKKDLLFFEHLKEHIQIVYEKKQATAAQYDTSRKELAAYPNITKDNYLNIYNLIDNEMKNISSAEAELNQTQTELNNLSALLSTVERITNGTYVQQLALDETHKRVAEISQHRY